MLPDPGHQIFLVHHHVRLEEQQVTSPEFAHQHDAITNFEPSLVVAIGVLAIIFSFTILLVLYFRLCHRNAVTISGGDQQASVFFSSAANVNPASGLDRKAIQSLPFFRFGVLRGSKEGLECSVCLSKYEDAEILRLLPKCRHAFHVDCVDRWLFRHSTCPLCRSEVVINDAENNMEESEDSISIGNRSSPASIVNSAGIDLFVEREDEEVRNQDTLVSLSSPAFSIGSSFRRLFAREGRIPVSVGRAGARDKVLHKHNHKIVFSDVVFKNRWSNVSSSDLIFLNSQMMISSGRFSDRDFTVGIGEAENFQRIGEELSTKAPISVDLAKRDSNASSSSPTRALLNAASGAGDSSLVEGRRSVSEITLYSRFKELGWLNCRERENPATGADGGSRGAPAEEEGEMKRKIWFPIARKTVELFANARKEESESRKN